MRVLHRREFPHAFLWPSALRLTRSHRRHHAAPPGRPNAHLQQLGLVDVVLPTSRS